MRVELIREVDAAAPRRPYFDNVPDVHEVGLAVRVFNRLQGLGPAKEDASDLFDRAGTLDLVFVAEYEDALRVGHGATLSQAGNVSLGRCSGAGT